MKTRVSLTMDASLLKSLDRIVDGINVTSRSNAVERILRERLSQEVAVVVLCGGSPESLLVKGTKTLRPLADVNGTPLLGHQLEKCGKAGFTRVILVGQKAVLSKIMDAVGDGKRYGVSLEFVQEKNSLGDANTLLLARERIHSNFLVLPCDYYHSFDLRKLFEFHLRSRGLVTMAAYAGVHSRSATCFLKMEGDRVVECGKNASGIVGTLVMAAKPELFDYLADGEAKRVMRYDVFPRLAREGKLAGYLSPASRVNVHDLEGLREAQASDKRVLRSRRAKR